MDIVPGPHYRSENSIKITIILNPVAGRGRGARYRRQLEEVLARPFSKEVASPPISAQWQILETTGPGSAQALAATAAADGADIIVAAGGDGTCGAVVNGIVGAKARLGILPFGTGNDLARFLGLMPQLSAEHKVKGINNHLEFAVQTILHGTPQPVDLGQVKGRWFINVAGCGFDAVVAERINQGVRHLHGKPAYIVAVLQSLHTFRAANLRLTLDGVPHKLRAMLCAVANAQGYGGGMKVAPDSKIDDGFFDLCVIREAGPLEFLCAFPSVFKGTHITHPKVSMFRARHVVIESDPPLPLLVDGEIMGTTPAEFTLSPQAIEVMVP